MGVTSKVETITPEKASRWLEKMAPNRHLRDGKVIQHAEAMERGEWRVNGEAIKFDVNGLLIDGQHRLKAVELFGQSVDMVVTRGLDPEVVTTIDVGMRRTLADTLRMRGEVNPLILGATLFSTIQCRHAFETGSWPNRQTGSYPSIEKCLVLLNEEPGIREAVKYSRHFTLRRTGLKVHPKTWATSIHILGDIDYDDMEGFVGTLGTGVDLSESSVLYMFRRRFMSGNPDSPVSARDQFAYMFKTWNYWREGTAPAQLRTRFGGTKPEVFPVPSKGGRRWNLEKVLTRSER